ncbi:MAG TPA: SMP-30/gluconolactonase/LRE family protein [bacterium]|nr:SMP-30/gluconolactonase/LRE family protein [bacterium]
MSLYPPPQIIHAQVAFRLPDALRKRGRRTDWTDAGRMGDSPHSFLEGPSFDREGNLYVVDIPFGRVFRISPQGEWKLITEYDGNPNGLKIHRDGRIFLADYKNGLMLLDPASGKVTPVLERRHLERFKGPNDLFFASNGDIWFTDQGPTGMHDPTGRVYRLNASDGSLDQILNNVPSPNGLVLNPDETQLYLAVTRANCVWRVNLHPDGTVYKAGVFLQLSGANGPDGMALDEAGNIVVAHVGGGQVWVFSPLGEPLYRIRSPQGLLTTNVAYGGPERKTLYITESASGCVLRVELPTAGKLMYSHT